MSTETADPPASTDTTAPDITPESTSTTDTTVVTPDTTTPAAADYHQLIATDGTFAEGFAASLPEELQGIAKTTPDISTAFERLRENQAAARQKVEGMVKLPGEDATPEDIAAYRKAIGVPDSPDGYSSLDTPSDLPEGTEWNSEFADSFRQLAHDKNLTPDTVQAIAELYNTQQQTSATRQEAARAQLDAEKSQKLDEAFGKDRESIITKAKQVARSLGMDVSDGDLFATTENVKALADFAPRFGEDKLVPAEQVDARVASAERLVSITTNPKDPQYESWKRQEPNTVALVKKLRGEAPADMVSRMTGMEIEFND